YSRRFNNIDELERAIHDYIRYYNEERIQLLGSREKCGRFKKRFKNRPHFLCTELAHAIIRCFFGDGDIMHMTFFNSCAADTHELGFGA
uniref:IS3 family transposase n=1 Tax=Aggregatibacter kilianii TaxID=2025884 RepID=UPI000D657B7F